MRNFLLAAMAATALCGAGASGALGQSSEDGNDRWMTVRNESPLDAVAIFYPAARLSAKYCCRENADAGERNSASAVGSVAVVETGAGRWL